MRLLLLFHAAFMHLRRITYDKTKKNLIIQHKPAMVFDSEVGQDYSIDYDFRKEIIQIEIKDIDLEQVLGLK